MEQLPIVEPSVEDRVRLVAMVDQLQELRGQEQETTTLEREVDKTVYRTYGLSEEEIVEIERWHTLRQRLARFVRMTLSFSKSVVMLRLPVCSSFSIATIESGPSFSSEPLPRHHLKEVLSEMIGKVDRVVHLAENPQLLLLCFV
jgi:hypothetical protein